MRFYHLLILGFSCLFMGCDNNRLYEQNYDMEANAWEAEDSLMFPFTVADTAGFYNLFINVRNAPEYLYSNLYLFLKISAPNGKYSIDTVECLLADNKGRWYGKGSAGLIDNQILYKKNIRFPITGEYLVTYKHAMRTDELEGIGSMGFRIEAFSERTETTN